MLQDAESSIFEQYQEVLYFNLSTHYHKEKKKKPSSNAGISHAVAAFFMTFTRISMLPAPKSDDCSLLHYGAIKLRGLHSTSDYEHQAIYWVMPKSSLIRSGRLKPLGIRFLKYSRFTVILLKRSGTRGYVILPTILFL